MPRRLLLVCLVASSALALATRSPGAADASRQVFGRAAARPIVAGGDDVWADLTRRVGPYGGIATADDVRRLTADGLSLAVVSGISADVSAAIYASGARYIDTGPWNRLYAVCRRVYDAEAAVGQAQACTLAQPDKAAITAQVSSDLRRVETNPALAAFWILDDSPHADVSDVLATVHSLVRESNARSGFSRPTICGVGGNLDHKSTADQLTFAPDRQYMATALRNISPAGCDLVAPYFYGVASADDPSLVDWSMSDLLPFFLEALKSAGYGAPSDVLMPVAHAFASHAAGSPTYYVKPRADDIVAQMHAYCAAGAKSLLFFTWRSQDADFSYANDLTLRDGVMRGSADCRQLWRAGTRP